MKAFGFTKYVEDINNAYFEFGAANPSLLEHDILVENLAVALNPVDNLLRKAQTTELAEPRIVGFDSVGRVVGLGSKATKFKPGDIVYFAGSRDRQGTYAEFTAVDERITALAPTKVKHEEAASMPLTGITAYEIFADKLAINFNSDNSHKTVLIINGSGGVGSIAIQLGKLAGLKVIASASEKNQAWVKALGADLVIDHHKNLSEQLKEEVDYILVFTAVDPHWQSIVKLIKPFGHIATITNFSENLNLLKPKAASFHWEYMFAKSLYNMKDLASQGEYLADIAKWLDEGKIKTTVSQVYKGFTLENLINANKVLSDGHVRGKLVIVK